MKALSYTLFSFLVLCGCDSSRERQPYQGTIRFNADATATFSLQSLLENPFAVAKELLSNKDTASAFKFVVDSVRIDSRLWRVTSYSKSKTVVAESFDNDSLAARILRDKCKSFLIDAFGVTSDQLALTNEGDFEINNYWTDPSIKVGLSFYTIDKNVSSQITAYTPPFRYGINLNFEVP